MQGIDHRAAVVLMGLYFTFAAAYFVSDESITLVR